MHFATPENEVIQRGGAVAVSLFQLVELAQLAGLVPAEDDDASTVPLAITGARS